VNVSVLVSSRVNDPRVAEQVSAVVILPVLAIFFAQLSGLVALNKALVLWLAAGLVVIDALMLGLSVRLFQREVILTRWK
jgi:ABC-2 type transport system permease protein